MSAYNSKTVPKGTSGQGSSGFITIYRPTSGEDPGGGSTTLGTYLLESLTPKYGATLNKRPDGDGGPNGFWIVSDNVEGQAIFQMSSAASPTLANGDYFNASVRVDSGGTPVSERFVIYDVGQNLDAGYRKQAVSVIVDPESYA